MKDTELRERVDKLEGFITKHIGWDGYWGEFYDGHIYTRIKSLENKSFRVRYCKKCKHDTLQEGRGRYDILWTGCILGECHYCLTCGTLWKCEEKTVCKEVK